jgi:hypothetical protein
MDGSRHRSCAPAHQYIVRLLIYRYKHEAILHNDRILLIGGGAPFPVEESTLETIYELHLPSHKWRKIECKGIPPDGRRSHACQLYDNGTS